MSRDHYDPTEAIADALFDRIAPLLERIAAALEKANEGVVLSVVEETEDSGRGVFPLRDHGKDW